MHSICITLRLYQIIQFKHMTCITVRGLQARVLREEWEKREQLEKLQEEQQKLLEMEKMKRLEFERMQQENERQLQGINSKVCTRLICSFSKYIFLKLKKTTDT